MDRVLLAESSVKRFMRLKSEAKDDIVYFVRSGTWVKSERNHVEDDAVERGTSVKPKRKHGERGKRLKSKRKQVERCTRLKSEGKDDIVYFVERGTWVKSERKQVEDDAVKIGTLLKSERKQDEDDAVERGMRLKSERKQDEDDAVERGMRLKSRRKDDIVYFVDRGTWVKSDRKQDEDDAVERGTRLKSERKQVEDGARLKSEQRHNFVYYFKSDKCLKLDRKQAADDALEMLKSTSQAPPRRTRTKRIRWLGGGGTVSVSITDDTRPRYVRFSKFALEMYNHEHKQIPQFQFVRLVRAKKQSVCGFMHYITFIGKQANQESRAIVRYYAEKYADRGPDLLGTTLEEKAMVDQWLEVEAHNFNDLCFNIMFNLVILPKMGKPGDIGLVHRCEEKLEKVFDVYESRLSKSTYLAGDNFSLADLSHLPGIGHLIEGAKMGHLVSERKNVKAWWEKISSRPAWKKLKILVG